MTTTSTTVAARAARAMFVLLLAAATPASAQSPRPPADPDAPGPTSRRWSIYAQATSYALPEEDNYAQPTVIADRGALHLETRVNYEDLKSISGFVGWNFAFGESVALRLTPMIGAVAGNTDGVVPALELGFEWRRFEIYSEGEYVLPFDDQDSRYFYNWSEFSLWPTDWLRAGVVLQQTRVFETPRDLQRGLLAGVTFRRLEGSVYWFSPGAHEQFVAFTVGFGF